MKIKFKGKKRQYELTSDERQFILSEIIKAKTGKNKGEYVIKTIGYFSSLESILNKINYLEIVDSNATSFEELLKAVRDTKKYIGSLLSEKIKT